MKCVLTFLAAAAALIASAQMPSFDIPKAEKAKAAFFIGRFKSTSYKSTMPGMPNGGGMTVSTQWDLGGKYLESDQEMNLVKSKMYGKLMMSYDPNTKMWHGWWFDSSMPMVMHFTGTCDGKTLVATSDPTPMEGMPEPMVMRVVYVKGVRGYTFKLQNKEGEKWTTMVDAVMRRR